MARKRTPDTDGRACVNCVHYLDKSEPGDPILWGACRRYPPVWFQAGDEPTCDYPQTEAAERCGEWSPNQ